MRRVLICSSGLLLHRWRFGNDQSRRIDILLDLENFLAMNALSFSTFHSRLAFEKLFAMRTLECKCHLKTCFRF